MRTLMPDLAVLVAIVAVLGLIAFAAILSWESSLLLELRLAWARLLRAKARW